MGRKKVEKWIDEIYPGDQKVHSSYLRLSARVLPIVLGAVFDVALNELLQLRMRNDQQEVDALLGHSGQEAPVQAFKAKIRLAYLLGLLEKHEAELMRALADIRNVFAHRVKADYSDHDVVKHLGRYWEATKCVVKDMPKRELSEDYRIWFERDYFGSDYATDKRAAQHLLVTSHSFLHERLHRRSMVIKRLTKGYGRVPSAAFGFGAFSYEDVQDISKSTLNPQRYHRMDFEHPAWFNFINMLSEAEVKEGCDAESHRPLCRRILRNLYGMNDEQIEASLEFFETYGGYCDCEVVINYFMYLDQRS